MGFEFLDRFGRSAAIFGSFKLAAEVSYRQGLGVRPGPFWRLAARLEIRQPSAALEP